MLSNGLPATVRTTVLADIAGPPERLIVINGIIAAPAAASQVSAAVAVFASKVNNEGANRVPEKGITPDAINSLLVTGFACPVLAHKGISFLLFIKRSPKQLSLLNLVY